MASSLKAKRSTNPIPKTPPLEEAKGVIGDLEKYIFTSLFNKIYVLNDLKIENPEHWAGERGNFEFFFEKFFDISQGVSNSETKSWTHTETLENWILPILHSLGWGGIEGAENDHFALNASVNFVDETGNDLNAKPTVVIAESVDGKKRIKSAKFDGAFQEVRNFGLVCLNTGYYDSWSEMRSGLYDNKRDELTKFGDVFSNYNSNEKASFYLKTFGHNWGIATDGYTWRLFSKSSTNSPSTFFEFKLGRLFDDMRTSAADKDNESIKEAIKYFYWFFSKEGLFGKPISLANTTLSRSKNYFEDLEDDLKGRFVHAMTISVNGLFETFKGKSNEEDHLDLIRDTSESLIFSLLFIRSCESNRVIPHNQSYLKVSLASLIRRIRDYSPQADTKTNFERLNFSVTSLFGKAITPNGYEVFSYIQGLMSILQFGAGAKYEFGFKIDGFKETVFSTEELSFFKANKLPNECFIKLLFEMFYESSNRKYLEIPFESFTPRHLGSIYESFLEYRIAVEKKAYLHVKRIVNDRVKWKWIPKSKFKENSAARVTFVIRPGDLRFKPADEDKKEAGAVYTPDVIVQHIVNSTLRPLVVGKSAEKILSLKVCDPAMGSGHFLIAALNFLSAAYVRALTKGGGTLGTSDLVKARREILKSCIFGIDKNPRAVKLAKLSLWLESAAIDRNLERLDDQLIHGNSLHQTTVWKEHKGMRDGAFDAVVGNPPYVRANAMAEEDREYCRKHFKTVTGAWDLFVPFLELCLKLCKGDGRYGQILSNKIAVADYAELIRKQLIEDTSLEMIFDYTKCKKIFDSASVVPITIIGSKTVLDIPGSISVGTPKDEDLSDPNKVLTAVSPKDLLGKKFAFEIFKTSDDNAILDSLFQNPSLESVEPNVRTGIMGFEYWDHEPFIKDAAVYKGKGATWKVITPGLFNRLEYTWGTDSLKLYKKKFAKPVMLKQNNLLSSETEDMFNSPKVVIRGVGKGICAILDIEGIAPLVGVHSVVSPKFPYFTLALFNSLLVDWIYATKLLGSKIPQGSLKYPLAFIKNLPFKEAGLNDIETRLKALLSNTVVSDQVVCQMNEIILNHYSVERSRWIEMYDKVRETIDLDYDFKTFLGE
ncbi:MAG: N-6 DNA methylase [Bdellovibrionales bacterium]|nr:N-6 DNA methylase [Bdellovibrionales bacterium]